jgi:hypothetical protein
MTVFVLEQNRFQKPRTQDSIDITQIRNFTDTDLPLYKHFLRGPVTIDLNRAVSRGRKRLGSVLGPRATWRKHENQRDDMA